MSGDYCAFHPARLYTNWKFYTQLIPKNSCFYLKMLYTNNENNNLRPLH